MALRGDRKIETRWKEGAEIVLLITWFLWVVFGRGEEGRRDGGGCSNCCFYFMNVQKLVPLLS